MGKRPDDDSHAGFAGDGDRAPTGASKKRKRTRRRGGRRRNGGGHVYAALDLGTNNCRLLVARSVGERTDFRVVDAFSRIVRLGEGLTQSGHLSELAMRRTIEALRICASKMSRRSVTTARCVATEACRRARNCDEFLDRVLSDTGIQIEIISTEEEAWLALAGCSPLLDHATPHALVFDIGGGSTELSWLRVRPEAPPEVLDWMSLSCGVVTLTERFSGDRIGLPLYREMVETVKAELAPFEARHGIAEAVAATRVQMLGTSGTVTTLAGVHLDLPRYNRDQVDGTTLRFDTIDQISNRLAEMDYQERARLACIGRDRADLVVSGCAILSAIRELWPVGSLTVADRGVREGILMGLIGDRRHGQQHPDAAGVPSIQEAWAARQSWSRAAEREGGRGG